MSTIVFTSGTTPSAPTTGKVRLFIDSADNTLKSIDSAGSVTVYSGSSVESIQDIVGALISAGSAAVVVTYNDIGNTLTIDLDQAQIDHTLLQNVGTNTHAQIDAHIANTANPHSVTKAQVGLGSVPNVDATNPNNISQDATHRFVSDTEKSTWNAKQNALGYTPLNPANNLSDVSNTSTARTNLGLGSAATHPSTDFDAAGSSATVQTNLNTHIADHLNPHAVTKSQVGLANVPNVDATVPSNITQDATHRFVSDTQISTWDAKQNALGYTPLNAANNLSDLANTTTARTNLGLGTAATQNSTAFDAAGSATTAVSNHVAAADPHTQYIKADGTRAMAADLSLGGTHKVINAAQASSAGQYVEYAQWQASLSGIKWLAALQCAALVSDNLNTPPTPVSDESYIVGPTPTGAWAGKAGHLVEWHAASSTWVDHTHSPVQVGDRFGVNLENITTLGGGLVGHQNQIATVTNATPGAITYSFYTPSANDSVYVNDPLCLHFGDTYNFNGTNWVEIPGAVAISAGAGLTNASNTFNVNVDTTTIVIDGSNNLHVKDNTFDAFGAASTAQAASLQKISNLSDLTNAATARTNLGLGTAAVQNTSAFEPSITSGTTSQYFRGDKTFQTLDKTAVGLANVDNTSDATKNSAVATLTNKTISGASNTISNVGYSSLTLTGSVTNTDISATAAIVRSKLAALTASRAMVTDASGLDSASAVTATELEYLSGTTSAVQTQINSKQATITGAATTITTSNLTASSALVSDVSGKVAASAVTATELGYVSGVTSAIQTQINSKEPTVTAGTTAQYYRGDKTFQTLNSAAVGLGNVNNTADTAKVISGDVTGTLGASTVAKLQGVAVSASAPTTGQVLKYDGTQWAPGTDNNSGGGGGSSLLWTVTTVSNSTLSLTSSSNKGNIFTGTVGGQVVDLPDATTLSVGDTFYFINKSDPIVSLKDAGGNFQTFVIPTKEVKAILLDNSSVNGVWTISTYAIDYGSMRLYDDFVSASATTNQIAALGWTITTGTVAYQAITGQSNGVIRVNTGTGNNNAGALNLGTASQILLNNSITFCEQRINFPSIGGTAAAALSFTGGLLNAATNVTPGTLPLNAIGFAYQGTTGTTTNLIAFASSATLTTSVDTTVAVTAGTWYKCTFIVNAAGTAAYFYVNNNYIGTINTNLPTAIVMAPMIKMNSGATNAAAKSVDVDYYDLQKLYTTVR